MKLEWLEPRPDAAPLTVADLAAVGVIAEHLAVGGDPSVAAAQPRLDALMAARGYVTQDVVELHPDTAGLDALLDKFAGEHLHTDDEVRYVLAGEGVFDLRSADDRWMRVVVEPGDLIVVPADLHHRFYLTDARTIRCVRLFKDASGWVAHYRDQAAAS
jgi:1,2-dihydroxy-3-keto-5-methylthiopentene dioxygenase